MEHKGCFPEFLIHVQKQAPPCACRKDTCLPAGQGPSLRAADGVCWGGRTCGAPTKKRVLTWGSGPSRSIQEERAALGLGQFPSALRGCEQRGLNNAASSERSVPSLDPQTEPHGRIRSGKASGQNAWLPAGSGGSPDLTT